MLRARGPRPAGLPIAPTPRTRAACSRRCRSGRRSNVDQSTSNGPPGLISGDNTINYTTTGGANTGNLTVTGDSIVDTDPYPRTLTSAPRRSDAVGLHHRPAGAGRGRTASCRPGGRNTAGLHNLWYVFLPAGVDECILPGVCGTNAFGGYHSVSDVGNGVTIYAVTIDPIIEAEECFEPGNDPQGNPDAEVTADIAGHETDEAMTDPEGVGYMDPNGFEVADKCEFGRSIGTPLGHNDAPGPRPYNQVINGDEWLLQEMWSNQDVPARTAPRPASSRPGHDASGLPLPQVDLTQFKRRRQRDRQHRRGDGRRGRRWSRCFARRRTPVATASTSGPRTPTATGPSPLPHPVGDDRDEIDVDLLGRRAPTPHHQVILTGNGGNPLNEVRLDAVVGDGQRHALAPATISSSARSAVRR